MLIPHLNGNFDADLHKFIYNRKILHAISFLSKAVFLSLDALVGNRKKFNDSHSWSYELFCDFQRRSDLKNA